MRRRVIRATLPCALLLALTLSFPSPASASDSFTFYGSGDGHGIGMSQWGAYGLARMGWTDTRIVEHFYKGSKVVTSSSLPGRIRVGLTWGRTVVHLRAQAGPVRLWIGHAGGTLVGAIPSGDTWTVTARKHDWGIRRPNGKLVGGHGWGGPRNNLIVTYQDQGSRVFIPEADAIWYRGFSYKRGSIEMNLTSCGDANGCMERLIARLGFEDYLLGLGEVPASWPMAAMQAQAIAARSYAAYDVKHYGLRSDCNCDLSDGSGDQTYIGYNREAGTDGARWVKAVRSSAHQVATYGGNVIQAFYAASDGGHSDSVQDVWHGGNPAYKIPWLTGVCDPGEWTDANPWTAWKKSYSASYVTSRLAPYSGSIGTIRRFRSIHRTSGGRIMSAVAVGSSGSHRVDGDQMKAALGWYDQRVWINSDHTIRGAIRHRYDTLGCKPGLPTSPQRVVAGGAGAQQFFAHGGMYRNNNADLTLWLHGPIDREFRAVGATTGVLGLPTSSPTSLLSATKGPACDGCRRISFVGGRIYDGPSTGAHALWGNVLDTYNKHGGAGGALGMPTTRVQDRDGGGVRARFEHGTIVCRHGTCRVVTG
jgi:SpoIID/LytB domain protein